MASSVGTVLKDMGVTIWQQPSSTLRAFLEINKISPIITEEDVYKLLQENRGYYRIVANDNGSATFITYSQTLPERSKPIRTTLTFNNSSNDRSNTLKKIEEKLDIEELYKAICADYPCRFLLYPTADGEQIRCLHYDYNVLLIEDFEVTADGHFLVPLNNKYQQISLYQFIDHLEKKCNLSSYFPDKKPAKPIVDNKPVVTVDPAARFIEWCNANLLYAFEQLSPRAPSPLSYEESPLLNYEETPLAASELIPSCRELDTSLAVQLIAPQETDFNEVKITPEEKILSDSALESCFKPKSSTSYEDAHLGTPKKRIPPKQSHSSISSSPNENEKENEDEDGNIIRGYLKMQTLNRFSSKERKEEIEKERITGQIWKRLNTIRKKLFLEENSSHPMGQNGFTDNSEPKSLHANPHGFHSNKRKIASDSHNGSNRKRRKTSYQTTPIKIANSTPNQPHTAIQIRTC